MKSLKFNIQYSMLYLDILIEFMYYPTRGIHLLAYNIKCKL